MALTLDARHTALVLIDLQRGIVGRELAPHSASDVVRRAVGLGHACVAANAPIVPVNVAFSADSRDQLALPVDAPMQRPQSIPADWSELAPEIAALPAAFTITKRQWGAFYGTELDLQLRRRAVTTIILCGIATNYGVESTAREAWQHNYAVVIAEDATTSLAPELHRFSVEHIFPRLARVRPTADIIAALTDKRG